MTRVINGFLWLAYILALSASVSHVAGAFATIHAPGEWAAGWAAAVAIDAGLAALAYSIQQRKRAKRPTKSLWGGVVLFAGISAYANVLYALQHTGDLFRAIVLAASLPLLVVYLGEVVSSDDAAAAEAAEREQRRAERKAEKYAQEQAAPSTPVAHPPDGGSVVARLAQAHGKSPRTIQRWIAAGKISVPVNGTHVNGKAD